MGTKNAVRWLGRMALVLLLGGCTTQCGQIGLFTSGEDRFDLFCGEYSSSKRFSERYLAVRGKRGVQDASGLMRVPGELWGPFRVEVTVWVLGDREDPAVQRAEGGLEVDVRGSSPAQWWAVRTRRTSTGLTAWVTSHAGGVLGSVDFEASQADLAVEFDGAKLRLLARERLLTQETQFVELASVDHAQTLPMNPGLSVAGVDAGITLGFDDADVVFNGEPPVPRDGPHQAVQDLAEAADAILDAHGAIDGIFPGDPADAVAPLTAAAAELAAVRAYAASLPAKKKTPRQRALAAVGKAEKSVAKARAVLAKKGQDGIGSASKHLLKALPQLGYAASAVAPPDLLAPPPGRDP